MTITLSHETEAALEARAASRGLRVDDFVAEILQREATESQNNAANASAGIDDFFNQLRKLSSTVPAVSDPNFTRETIYQDHD